MIAQIILYLFTFVTVGSAIKITDLDDFQQLKSNQAFYSAYASGAQRVLPFKTPIADSIYDANGFCFVSMTSDGLIWSARQNNPQKDDSNGDYGAFTLVYDFNDYLTNNPSVVEVPDAEKIQKLVKTADSILVLTSSRIVEVVMDYKCSSFVSVVSRLPADASGRAWGDVHAAASSDQALWLGTSAAGLLQISFNTDSSGQWETHSLERLVPATADPVSALEYAAAWDTLYVGTQAAVYAVHFAPHAVTKVAGTPAPQPLYATHEWVMAVVDSAVVDMHFDAVAGALWVLDRQALHWLDADGLWWRQGHYQGSITNNLTALAPTCIYHPNPREISASPTSDCFVWVATDHMGLMRRSYPDTARAADTEAPAPELGAGAQWSLFNGPRFLPGSANVLQLVSDAPPSSSSSAATVLAVTEFGVAFLSSIPYSLPQKAEAMLAARSRHDRDGITTDTSLTEYTNVESYTFHPEDSDSIWTGQYAVASAMRFSATGAEADRQDAWYTFEAMERLATISGTRGYVARTLCSPTERRGDGPHPTIGCGTDGEGGWTASSAPAFPADADGTAWVWKGDTSSDTVTGHYFAYSVLLDEVARTDEEKARVAGLITDITDYIVDNDFFYMDPLTGEPTLWGLWNPTTLNDDPERYGERGGNSLEILSYLAIAYSVTGDAKYRTAYMYLGRDSDVRADGTTVQGGGYFRNVLNCKIDVVDEDNHSDNQLDYMAYHTLFYSLRRLDRQLTGASGNVTELRARRDTLRAMVAPVVPSVKRWWSIVRREHSPLWLSMVAGAAGLPVGAADREAALQVLRDYPLDLLDWGIKNSGRWDVKAQPYGDRGDQSILLLQHVRPAFERIVSHYNLNPFKMDSSTDPSVDLFSIGGTSELAPTEWLLPYYMMVFYDLL